MSANLSLQWMELRTRWRRARRKFDARMMTERRILIVAAVCISWFALDAMWVTPAYQRLKLSMQAHAQLQDKQAQNQAQQDTLMDTLRAQKERALAELDSLRVRLTRQQDELEEVQAQMAPARDMRQLLDALLARHANLRVLNMKTLPPVELKAPGSNEAVLYRHGLSLELSGRFHDLLAWLQSAEQMPRKLIWGSLDLHTNTASELVLRVQVYTLSPDKDPLEIAP